VIASPTHSHPDRLGSIHTLRVKMYECEQSTHTHTHTHTVASRTVRGRGHDCSAVQGSRSPVVSETSNQLFAIALERSRSSRSVGLVARITIYRSTYGVVALYAYHSHTANLKSTICHVIRKKKKTLIRRCESKKKRVTVNNILLIIPSEIKKKANSDLDILSFELFSKIFFLN